jgi:hypothetical protein
MRRFTCLTRMNKAFGGRLNQLDQIAQSVSDTRGHDADRAVAFVTIEAMTAWSNFAREFYLACAFLRPKTISGKRVHHANPSINDEREALIHSIAVLKGKTITAPRILPRDEPAWHEKRALSALSKSMTFSNNQSIIDGLSYETTFFDQAPTIRNFFAHRSLGTASKVTDIAARRYGLSNVDHATDLINVIFTGRTQTVVQEWLGDIRQIGATMCA